MSNNKDAGEIAEPDRQVKAEDQKRVEEPGQHRDGHAALMDEQKLETISGLAVILLLADIPIQAVLVKAEDQKRVEEPGQHRDGHAALMDEKKFETLSGLAAILLLADIPIQAVLVKTSFPNLSLSTALLLGAAFAIFICKISEGAAFLATEDRNRPQRGIQKALWLACGTGLVSLVAGSILLYARSATEVSAEFVSVTNAALWTLSEGMGLTAGFLGAARRSYLMATKGRQDELGAFPEERNLAS